MRKTGLGKAEQSDYVRELFAAGLPDSSWRISPETKEEWMRRARRAVASREVGGADPRLVLLTESIPMTRKIQSCNSEKILLTEACIIIGASVDDGKFTRFSILAYRARSK